MSFPFFILRSLLAEPGQFLTDHSSWLSISYLFSPVPIIRPLETCNDIWGCFKLYLNGTLNDCVSAGSAFHCVSVLACG